MSDQLNRFKRLREELVVELGHIDVLTSPVLFQAVSMAEEQVSFSIHILEKRESQDTTQQMRLDTAEGVIITGDAIRARVYAEQVIEAPADIARAIVDTALDKKTQAAGRDE